VIISDDSPSENLDLFEFVKWDKSKEIDELLTFNIGVMPLSHDPWSEGKCGFKALQYMALGIPALVSPVGVNEKIVDDGLNGFICRTDSDWINHISYLLENRQEIIKMGLKGRKKIEAEFSVLSNTSNFIHLFA
jgi:glycosyltransferase involved in cell wall biosynthesis